MPTIDDLLIDGGVIVSGLSDTEAYDGMDINGVVANIVGGLAIGGDATIVINVSTGGGSSSPTGQWALYEFGFKYRIEEIS